MVKIATWNVNSLRVRLPHVLAWLEQYQPDVLALQETKLVDDAFPIEEIQGAGYQAVFAGQKTYNGMAILSREPVVEIQDQMPNFPDDPQKRFLGATIAGIRILNLYVPNGAEVDSEKYHYKLVWLDKLIEHVKELKRQYPYLLLLGDFNIAPADIDVHDPKHWEGKVLVSPLERAQFARLLDTGLVDTFRALSSAQEFSWWNYREFSFRRNRGLRIDHILVTPELLEKCQSCVIDKEPRKLERPSDHTPVIATFDT